MSTSSIGGASNQSQLLQQLMKMTQTPGTNSDDAADSAGDMQVLAPATPPGAPPAAGSTPSDMFSPDILSVLTSAQAGGADPSAQAASTMAGQMVDQLDTDGDGEVSLSEMQTALGADGANASDGLTNAFAQLDTNGDGSLSTDELTTGLQKMAGGSQGVHGHHGHHGHGGGPPPTDDADATDPSSDPDPSIATGAASSSSTTATSGATPAAPTADSLQALMAQLQQYQSASQLDWADTQRQLLGLTA
jgi:hypothetical protein